MVRPVPRGVRHLPAGLRDAGSPGCVPGIDSGDTNRSNAIAFLHTFPISYPTYYDQSGQAGLAVTDSSFTPVTVFYNRNGGVFIHQGQYPSVAKLEQDIRLYALEG